MGRVFWKYGEEQIYLYSPPTGTRPAATWHTEDGTDWIVFLNAAEKMDKMIQISPMSSINKAVCRRSVCITKDYNLFCHVSVDFDVTKESKTRGGSLYEKFLKPVFFPVAVLYIIQFMGETNSPLNCQMLAFSNHSGQQMYKKRNIHETFSITILLSCGDNKGVILLARNGMIIQGDWST